MQRKDGCSEKELHFSSLRQAKAVLGRMAEGYAEQSRMRFPQIEIHFSKTPKATLFFFFFKGELNLRSIRCSHEWLMLRAEGSALLDHAESLMQSGGRV